MKVNIIGTFFGQTGYDVHTRQLANAMEDEGIEVSLTTQRPNQWERMVSDKELKMLLRNPEEADINLLIGIPPFWKYHLNDNKKFVGFIVWEGSKIPIGWLDILKDKRVNQIWVPSKHTKDAILNTVNDIILEKIPVQIIKENEEFKVQEYPEEGWISRKIKIVPHGVDSNMFYSKPSLHKEFTFLFNGGWPAGSRDRKGLSFLLKAYLEEFTSKDNVKLLVKINSTYGMNQQLFDRNLKELEIQNTDKPKLEFITEDIPYNKLVQFYNEGDVFVISSLAEGFHLGGLEAMSCGLPVLSTDFGGQIEYINKDNGWILENGKMIEVVWDSMYEGVNWCLPSIKEMKYKLRDIFNNQHQINYKSIQAINTSKEFTWKNSAKKAQLFLNEII